MSDIYLGDCREVRSVLADNSIDTIITDPPYGLEFMGKGWDKGVPGVEFWKEFLAVTKPGGMLLAFGGTRTFHRMTAGLEDAGWKIRDCMMWLYGSGFPKSHNLHGEFQGWGTALKPAWEPIIVAMKPIDGTFAENAEKWGVAGINVDGGRIGTTEKLQGSTVRNDIRGGAFAAGHMPNPGDIPNYQQSSKGRWPANLILDEEAARMLDGQTEGTRASKPSATGTAFKATGTFPIENDGPTAYRDSGGASRFFYVAKASKSERNAGCEGLQAKRGGYRPNDDSAENSLVTRLHKSRPEHNNHPTVKPLKLMEYLCTLTKTPTGGIVLDPFAGSGTTLLAAKNTGREYVGIEQNLEYFQIIKARLGLV